MPQLRPRLREARRSAGLTQQQLADRLGVDQAVIARWETGAREPRVRAAVRLSELLGTTANELWPARAEAVGSTPQEPGAGRGEILPKKHRARRTSGQLREQR